MSFSTESPGLGLDVGGTLVKIVYFQPLDEGKNTFETDIGSAGTDPIMNFFRNPEESESPSSFFDESNPGNDKAIHKDAATNEEHTTRAHADLNNKKPENPPRSTRSGRPGRLSDLWVSAQEPIRIPGQGLLLCKRFETWRMEEFLTLVGEKVNNGHGPRIIHATGGGARKFGERFEASANIELQRWDELLCLVRGIDFLARNCPHDCFECPGGTYQGGAIQRPWESPGSSSAGSSPKESSGRGTPEAAPAQCSEGGRANGGGDTGSGSPGPTSPAQDVGCPRQREGARGGEVDGVVVSFRDGGSAAAVRPADAGARPAAAGAAGPGLQNGKRQSPLLGQDAERTVCDGRNPKPSEQEQEQGNIGSLGFREDKAAMAVDTASAMREEQEGGGGAHDCSRPPSSPDRVPFSSHNLTYPYLVVNIGSGVSFLRVDSPSHFERVGGTSLGGSTFLGLTCALTGCTDFSEAMELASHGDSSNVDMLVGDIYGGDYIEMGLAATTVASSFGKLVRPSFRNSLQCSLSEHQHAANLAKAALLMVTNNVGSLAMLHARAAGVRHIIFAGSFLHSNKLALRSLAVAVDFWSRGEMKAVFLRHEGHAGATGALLCGSMHSGGPRTEDG